MKMGRWWKRRKDITGMTVSKFIRESLWREYFMIHIRRRIQRTNE